MIHEFTRPSFLVLALALAACAPADDADDDDSGVTPDDDDDDAECEEDTMEENDDLLSSRNVLPNGYGGLVACPGDPDWYNFGAQLGDRIDFELTLDQGDVELEAQVLDSAGTVLGETSGTEGAHSIDLVAPDGDQYFVRIELAPGETESVLYAFSVYLNP